MPEIREPQVQMLYRFLNHMTKVSNDNLTLNTDHLFAKNASINTNNIQWVDPSKQRYDPSKFKLT